MNKYRNQKTTVDNIVFDSKKEAARYEDLKLMVKSRDISDLELQPKFPVVINGKKICTYIADFRYSEPITAIWANEAWTAGQRIVVEDAKGIKTPVYRLKKKLVEAIYGIKIQEV